MTKKLEAALLIIFLFTGINASKIEAAKDYAQLKEAPGAKVSDGSDIVIRNSHNIHGFGKNYDADIYSPKSVTFSKDGSKIYVNSLEGCKTVVYDADSHTKLKVIDHKFDSGVGSLWLKPSGFYEFTHYPDGASRAFSGKPVEAALSKDGRYLFVPYYRRTFDLNAQDPSALAIIDTEKDEIVGMTETGPLPKMVKVSNDGRLLAITHWGNNTVGFLDISDPNPSNWNHLEPITIGHKLNLNYSLTNPVNRDSGSGYLLRGTVFLPGDSLLLISGMAGPVAVIDVRSHEWIGMIPQLAGVRHITMKNGLLYMSRNSAGEVLTVPVEEIKKAVNSQRNSSRSFSVEGIRRAKVGSGARTLKVSPSGKYIFVACNSASQLCVVRTEDMKLVATINADSYPVGLDISPDGSMVITTSQGRNGVGGNAVDFFEVAYAEPENSAEPETEAIELPAEDTAVSKAEVAEPVNRTEGGNAAWIISVSIAGFLILIAAFFVYFNRKNTHKKSGV